MMGPPQPARDPDRGRRRLLKSQSDAALAAKRKSHHPVSLHRTPCTSDLLPVSAQDAAVRDPHGEDELLSLRLHFADVALTSGQLAYVMATYAGDGGRTAPNYDGLRHPVDEAKAADVVHALYPRLVDPGRFARDVLPCLTATLRRTITARLGCFAVVRPPPVEPCEDAQVASGGPWLALDLGRDDHRGLARVAAVLAYYEGSDLRWGFYRPELGRASKWVENWSLPKSWRTETGDKVPTTGELAFDDLTLPKEPDMLLRAKLRRRLFVYESPSARAKRDTTEYLAHCASSPHVQAGDEREFDQDPDAVFAGLVRPKYERQARIIQKNWRAYRKRKKRRVDKKPVAYGHAKVAGCSPVLDMFAKLQKGGKVKPPPPVTLAQVLSRVNQVVEDKAVQDAATEAVAKWKHRPKPSLAAYLANWHVIHFGAALGVSRLHELLHTVCKSNLQPDFNVRVCECFDASTAAVLRALDESDRFVQKSAESTSM